MSTYRMTITVEVDDEALEAHDGDQKPPPNDVYEWYQTDLIEAVNSGLAEVSHDEVEEIEEVTS